MLVDSSDLDTNNITIPFFPLVAYYLDLFVLAVCLVIYFCCSCFDERLVNEALVS